MYMIYAYDIMECSLCCFKDSITQDAVHSKIFECWHWPNASFGYSRLLRKRNTGTSV